jgi:DNA-binding MarR family transcriptional regulator
VIKGDRRRRHLQLAARAVAVLATARGCSQRAENKLLGSLSAAKRAQLLQILVELALPPETSAPVWEPLGATAAKSRRARVPALYNTLRFLSGRCMQVASPLLAQELSDLKLTGGQLGVLYLVATLSPVDQASLGRALRLDKSTVSLVVSAFAVRDIVTRTPNPRRKGQLMVHLTPAGMNLTNEALIRGARADTRLFKNMRVGTRERFVALLTTVINACAGFDAASTTTNKSP